MAGIKAIHFFQFRGTLRTPSFGGIFVLVLLLRIPTSSLSRVPNDAGCSAVREEKAHARPTASSPDARAVAAGQQTPKKQILRF